MKTNTDTKNFIAKSKRNKTDRFAKADYVINKFKSNKKLLVKILTNVYENNPDWWNWKSNHSAEKEAKEVLNDILNNKLDKGTQTTIACLYFGLQVVNEKIDLYKALDKIHNYWAYITYHYENGVKEKRKHQFIPSDKLSNTEKLKDLDWIYAVYRVSN